MRPRGALAENTIAMAAPSTIQKRKARADQIKAAREKYTQFSRAGLPHPATTVPLDRPTTSRLRPPSASALPPPGSVFRSDPAAAAAIRAGPVPSTTLTGRSSTVPRPSLAPRPEVPRPSMVARPIVRAPRPSMLPRDLDAPFGLPFGSNFNLSSSSSSSVTRPPTGPSSSSFAFEPMGESLNRIMRNEPLPMAPGARASSIARRPPRPSMMPGAINIFTATGSERMEAERLLGTMTPRLRMNRGDESVARSRVRFEMVESIQEQRESVGDEQVDEPTSSAAFEGQSTTRESTLHRDLPSHLPSLLSSIHPISRPLPSISLDPPRSILKQKKSPRSVASASSSSVIVASSSTSILTNSTIDVAANSDENQPMRGTPSRGRLTPARNGSSKNRKKNQGMMDVFAILSGMSEEEKRETPHAMVEACLDMLKRMDEEKRQEEEETEEEESVMERGIVDEEEEEEEHSSHETIPLHELTVDGTPRRRSSRLASSQGKVPRSLFID